MLITPDGMPAQDVYKLLTGIVVPRPIAWVTTLMPEGGVNLAPFSCFTFVSSKPPMVGINVGLRSGALKDTGRNIDAAGEFVVNIGDDSMVEEIHRSAAVFPPEVSEVEVLGLQTLASERIRTPRLAHVPIAMECRLHSATAYGETGSRFMVGEVVAFHVRDGLCNGVKIDTAKLRPACRIGGPNYASLGPIVSMAHVGEVRTGPENAIAE